MDFDSLLVGSVLVLIFAIGTTTLYYYRMKKVAKAYAESKNVVGDIVVSFNKELRMHQEQLAGVGYRLEAISSKSEDQGMRVEKMEQRVTDVISKVMGVSEGERKLEKDLASLAERTEVIAKTQDEIRKHVLELPEAKIEAAIPIKKERALAPLTETELRVLEIIAEDGEKTAPEIKHLINLTREHTARLVKKLYEEGYLERNTEKIPYTYRVKEEMLRILKKPQTET